MRAQPASKRASRAVRLCMALSAKFHNDRLDRERKAAVARAAADEERKPRLKEKLRKLVREAMEIDADGRERDFEQRQRTESIIAERLYEDDIERDIARCSLGRICRDLGIEPDWDSWARDHWALEEMRFKPPGAPYAGSFARKRRRNRDKPAEVAGADGDGPAPASPSG